MSDKIEFTAGSEPKDDRISSSGKNTVSVDLEIDANIETVWNVLTGINEYEEWNPFVVAVIGSHPPVPDTSMQFTVRWRDGDKTPSRELVTEFQPPHEEDGDTVAQWTYRFDGFLHSIGMIRAIRVQRLIARGERTLYSSTETFRGWGSSFVPYKKVREGFIDQGNALKSRCEGQSSNNS